MTENYAEIIDTETFDDVSEAGSYADNLDLLDTFVRDIRRSLITIEGALVDPDIEALRHTGHSVLSPARTLGAIELMQLSEFCKTSNQLEDVRRHARVLLAEGEAALARFVQAARVRLDAGL